MTTLFISRSNFSTVPTHHAAYVGFAARRLVGVSTHTPLARRDCALFDRLVDSAISTHTPLARRDLTRWGFVLEDEDFNSHASCEA